MNIEQFPDEIILKMCHEMDTEDLSNAIRTSARVNSICKEVMDKRYNEYKEKIRENFKRIKDEIINIMIDDSNDLPTFKLDYKSTHIAITSWVKYTIRDGNMRNVNTEEMISYIDSIFKDLHVCVNLFKSVYERLSQIIFKTSFGKSIILFFVKI